MYQTCSNNNNNHFNHNNDNNENNVLKDVHYDKAESFYNATQLFFIYLPLSLEE
jgi:hypothetical protein